LRRLWHYWQTWCAHPASSGAATPLNALGRPRQIILALLLAMSALAAARPLREDTITVGASIGVALSGRCPASFEVFNLRGSR